MPTADYTVTEVTEVTDFRGKAGADSALVLDDVQAFLNRFIAYPSPQASTAHTLWVAHAHLVDVFENSPRLAFLSPEPGSGKSRCMELTEALVPRPVLSVNSTVAYVFRKISDEAGLPTLLMDEIDAVFSGAKSDGNEDLRGLLNSGYRRGATAGRAAVRGREIVTEEWPSFCAVALAGLNRLPDTLMTRSIVVNMKRRRNDQRVAPFRRRVNQPEALTLYGQLAEFADRVRPDIADAWRDLPEGIQDRDADIWEPMLAVADAAGGHWPVTARQAAVLMVEESQRKPATLGIKLLADIRAVMDGRDRIGSIELLHLLHGLESSPWASVNGDPIDPRFLTRTLDKYEIPTSKTVKINGLSVKGYTRGHFADAWDRYLPDLAGSAPTTDQDPPAQGEDVATPASAPVILDMDADRQSPPTTQKTGNSGNPGNQGQSIL
ncbi:hypothetical protein C3B61_06970 [Cryobacterium zongtaii]|uniref:DUF3631 domain-containing protein n=1 Tax=Cryobacterium zongtaii TaxID=1259217 RepID=A0A2S3ZJG0_9MICO|nr:hypothetical protein C3B61_06970 [Cryobacterium zongtaii]